MPKKQDNKDQSARFIEAAKKTGADKTGKPFEKAFKTIIKAKAARIPSKG